MPTGIYKRTKKHGQNISKANKGKTHWNYKDGKYCKKYYCKICGKEITVFSGAYGLGFCSSCARKGQKNPKHSKWMKEKWKKEIHPMKGKHHTKKTKEKISKSNIGNFLSDETKRNISLSLGGTGIPYENNNYPGVFYKIKPKIYKRDNCTCQLCGKKFNKNSGKLDVHHIDYNKENCKEENLISLCHKCNIKANFDRDYWYAYFRYVMENIK